MEGLTTEQEQIDELRRWWQKNGKVVVLAVVVGLAAMGGTRYWMGQQDSQRAAASALYDSMLSALEENDAAVVTDRGGTLLSQYSSTPYATLAALALAKVKYEQGDVGSAEAYLRWVLDNNRDEGMTHIARLRLARVMLADNRASAALELVSGVDQGQFGAQYEELRGDVHAALNQPDEARRAYIAAQSAMTGMVADRQMLQMKLDAVGGAGPADTAAQALESLIEREAAKLTDSPATE